MKPRHSRVAVAAVAAALGAGGCGGASLVADDVPTIDAARLAASTSGAAFRSDAASAYLRLLVRAMGGNACEAADAADARDRLFRDDAESTIMWLERVAHDACYAGFRRVRVALDPGGTPSVRLGTGGYRRRGDAFLVDTTAEVVWRGTARPAARTFTFVPVDRMAAVAPYLWRAVPDATLDVEAAADEREAEWPPTALSTLTDGEALLTGLDFAPNDDASGGLGGSVSGLGNPPFGDAEEDLTLFGALDPEDDSLADLFYGGSSTLAEGETLVVEGGLTEGEGGVLVGESPEFVEDDAESGEDDAEPGGEDAEFGGAGDAFGADGDVLSQEGGGTVGTGRLVLVPEDEATEDTEWDDGSERAERTVSDAPERARRPRAAVVATLWAPRRSPAAIGVTSGGALRVPVVAWLPGETVSLEVDVGEAQYPSTGSAGAVCEGHFPESPALRLIVGDEGGQVQVLARSSIDGVMAVLGDDGSVQCNDDYDGLDPGVDAWFEPGGYDIWLGGFGPVERHTATVTIE